MRATVHSVYRKMGDADAASPAHFIVLMAAGLERQMMRRLMSMGPCEGLAPNGPFKKTSASSGLEQNEW